MIPSLEGLATKAKEAPSPQEVRLAPLDTNKVSGINPVFQSLGDIFFFSFGGNMQQLLCILSLRERYISYSTELQYPTVTSKYLLISYV